MKEVISGNEAPAVASPLRALCLNSPAAVRTELERIGVDPAGIGRMLPKCEQHALLLPSVRTAAANILKQEMLSLGGDAAVARGTVACSVAATDVLLIGTRKQLTVLCNKLKGQPFGLTAMADKLAGLLATLATRPACWQTSSQQLPLDRPLIMGILNVTPDSFSDGGKHSDPAAAVAKALQLADDGADLIDIGGESTRPGAAPVSADEEISRILPVLKALSGRLSIPISVDTWKHQVARAVLDAGAEIINDISGLAFDPALAAVVAQHRAGLVLMHTRGAPRQMQQHTDYGNLMGELASALDRSAAAAHAAGIAQQQIVIDPGIGFAKDVQGNLEILRRLPELHSLGYPLLLGTSRKSFIGKVLQRDDVAEREFGTAATVALAVAAGVRILRVHDVRAMKDVALMAHAIVHQPS